MQKMESLGVHPVTPFFVSRGRFETTVCQGDGSVVIRTSPGGLVYNVLLLSSYLDPT